MAVWLSVLCEQVTGDCVVVIMLYEQVTCGC